MFCNGCLVRLIATNNEAHLDCPSCKKKHKVPNNGFPVDFRTNNLLDLLQNVIFLFIFDLSLPCKKNPNFKNKVKFSFHLVYQSHL